MIIHYEICNLICYLWFECMLVFGSKLFDFDLNSNSLFKEHTVQGSDIMFDSLFNSYVCVYSLHDCLWSGIHNYSIHV